MGEKGAAGQGYGTLDITAREKVMALPSFPATQLPQPGHWAERTPHSPRHRGTENGASAKPR